MAGTCSNPDHQPHFLRWVLQINGSIDPYGLIRSKHALNAEFRKYTTTRDTGVKNYFDVVSRVARSALDHPEPWPAAVPHLRSHVALPRKLDLQTLMPRLYS